MRAAWGEARAASCSPAAAFASSPGAAAPGRPHYAGGLPAAAMASRAVVRAGHSPQRFLVRAAVAAPARAAFPLSRSYPLPFRSNSSSTSFPRPLFLLLSLPLPLGWALPTYQDAFRRLPSLTSRRSSSQIYEWPLESRDSI